MKILTCAHLYNLDLVIRETNRKLYDSNDGLRCALAGAAKRRVRPLITGASHRLTQHET